MNLRFLLSICFLLLFVVGFSSCENREIQKIEKIREAIIGEWNWVQTQIIQNNSGAGKKLTPVSEGFTRKFKFQVSGRLDVFINDTLDISYNYRVIDIDVVRDERKKDIWLRLSDIQTDTVVRESSFIRITQRELFLDREIEFEVDTYEKL